MNPHHVIVFGSINMDLVASVPHLPKPGETLLGHQFTTVPGGKGANQAVAVARLGVPTYMVGRVGHDSFGDQLLASLQAAGVHIDPVFQDASERSGVAVIAVDDHSENHIIVIPGANGNVNQDDSDRLSQLLEGAIALLLQLEVPLAAVKAAAQAARNAGVTVILDPAPAHADLSPELYGLADIMTPNAVEAEQLVGFAITNPETAAKAANLLRQQGVGTAIVKLGAQGVYCASANEEFFMPAFSIQAVDTVAAGDAFNGGLAAALAAGLPLRQAVRWGAAAGALAAMKAGAQTSLPDRTTFDQFLKHHS